MESLLRGEFGFGGGSDALGEEVREMRWPVSLDIDRFAAAYHEIRVRLAGLEKENSSIRRKLRTYEMKFPTITRLEDGGGGVCCLCDSDEVDLIQTQNSNLQQKISTLFQELQESKAHELRLEEVIRAYERIHLEKSSVQKELDEMTTLAEQHVERIQALETSLGRRENLQQKKSFTHYLHLYTSLDAPYGAHRRRLHHHHHHHVPSSSPSSSSPSSSSSLDGPGPSLQSSRSLDALTDQKVQRLEAELEGAWHEARRACQREAELKAELQQLQEEIREEKQRQEESEAECEHCCVEWIQKAGDEQVNLALAYTELMEELNRIRTLTTEQNHILHHNRSPLQPSSPVLRHGPASPPSDPAPPSPHAMRSHFQGRRSYSDMADPSFSPRTIRTPVSTLPKRRSSSRAHLRPVPVGPRPSSAHGALQLSYQLPDSAPGPLATPPQSSEDEEEEWVELRVMTPPHLHPASEHAQSWPSIRLWMELEESEFRSCPLCQLLFPTGFPDDALITHIDTHLENSKI
ncbi:TANK-binding kinase 1-binding protein 1-like isoform X2 [Trichomycterus rosablanca]|uniref:TANK-binding kinase 1-binding protein 1-like isoform X2 n=1 Tax=Trichomycterus rosablanca TaxID=2290929 RepID=UPI002F35BED1